MELSEKLPAEYEERMLIASIDCDGGKGSGDACHAVGEFFSVMRNDHAKAREVYTRNCDDRRHSASCFNLGRLFLGGRGGDQDLPKLGSCKHVRSEAFSSSQIARHYAKMCTGNLGHGTACHHYGLVALQQGETGAGLKYLNMGCDKKDAASCFLVGSHLLRASEGRRDAPKAKHFFEKACDEGHGPACHNLAVMFKLGDDGVPKDQALFDKYAARTRELVKARGAARGIRVG